jgi:hypothetical protein
LSWCVKPDREKLAERVRATDLPFAGTTGLRGRVTASRRQGAARETAYCGSCPTVRANSLEDNRYSVRRTIRRA